MELSILLKMDKDSLNHYLMMELDSIIFDKAMKGIYTLNDYEFLLVELEKIWPCATGEGLIDHRVRKHGKTMFALASVEQYTDTLLELGECMPTAFDCFPKKPVLFFFKNKEIALHYYHTTLNIVSNIWECCKSFWGHYTVQDKQTLTKFAEDKEFENQKVWTSYRYNNFAYTVRWYQTTNNSVELLYEQNYDREVKPESVPDPGKILQFALDWTKEIWGR